MSPSSYRPRDRQPPSATDSLEEGQIASLPRRPPPQSRDFGERGSRGERREWEHERDPRVPPTVGSSSTSVPRAPRDQRGSGGGGDYGYPGARRRRRSSLDSRSRSPRGGGRERIDPRDRDRDLALERDKDRDRITDGASDKAVADALETFSRAMHKTLLTITSQSLAFQNLKRLEHLPRELMDGEIFNRAVTRTHEADTEVNESMKELHSSFKEVMRYATPRDSSAGSGSGNNGAGEGGRRRGSLSHKLEERDRQDRDRAVDKRILEKADREDLRSIWSKVTELERRFEGVDDISTSTARKRIEPGPDSKGKMRARDPTPPPTVLPAPPNDADDLDNSTSIPNKDSTAMVGQYDVETKEPGRAGKRSRARALLDDMLKRLEQVESQKEVLEDRYTALEDRIDSRDQEDYEIQRMGNGRWRIIEELRDPDGVIRSLKRKRRTSGSGDAPSAIGTGGMMMDGVEAAGADEAPTGLQSETTEKVEDGTMVEHTSGTGTGSDPMIKILKDQVESLKKELQEIKAGQIDREKEIISQVTATMRDEMKTYCRASMLEALDKVRSGKLVHQSPVSTLAPIPEGLQRQVPSPSLPSGQISHLPLVSASTSSGPTSSNVNANANGNGSTTQPQRRSLSVSQPSTMNPSLNTGPGSGSRASASPVIPHSATVHQSPNLPPPRPVSQPIGASSSATAPTQHTPAPNLQQSVSNPKPNPNQNQQNANLHPSLTSWVGEHFQALPQHIQSQPFPQQQHQQQFQQQHFHQPNMQQQQQPRLQFSQHLAHPTQSASPLMSSGPTSNPLNQLMQQGPPVNHDEVTRWHQQRMAENQHQFQLQSPHLPQGPQPPLSQHQQHQPVHQHQQNQQQVQMQAFQALVNPVRQAPTGNANPRSQPQQQRQGSSSLVQKLSNVLAPGGDHHGS